MSSAAKIEFETSDSGRKSGLNDCLVRTEDDIFERDSYLKP